MLLLFALIIQICDSGFHMPKIPDHISDCKNDIYSYGGEPVCQVSVRDCQIQLSNYNAYAYIGSVIGPTTSKFSHALEARYDAVYLLFSQKKDLITCNCQTKSVTVNHCDIQIKSCWIFQTVADVGGGTVQYEVYATHSDFTGYYCCSDKQSDAQANGIEKLKENDISCFTEDPTSDPTHIPTIEPTNIPTYVPTIEPTLNPS
eukprot:158243_1